jgi:hypothetical protein
MPPAQPTEDDPATHGAPSFTPESELIERRLGVATATEPLRFGSALRLRVKLGPLAFPLWALGLAAAVGAAAAAAWIAQPSADSGEELGTPTASVAGRLTPSATASPAGSLPTKDSKRGRDTLIDRATDGERKALDELAKRPPEERSSAESVALALGREAQRVARVRELGATLRKTADAGISRADLSELFGLVNDRLTSVVALAQVAKIEHSIGPDVLFHVWTATRERTDTTRLAEELLFSHDVRKRASPALAVVLDLRDTKDCAKVRGILTSATEHADRRSLVGLGRLKRRTGCGADGSEDCYACLRDGQEIEDAIKAAASREPPSFQ